MHINLELYRIFHFVVMAGSISGAAKELFISQRAVSQSFKQLEEKLGGKLFFRTSKGIKLTTEGEVLFKYIDQAYNIIRTAENKFNEMQNLAEGEIKIGAGDTLCRYYLIPYLELFHREYPGVKIHVTNRTTPETISLLKSGKVDLGIINLPTDVDNSVTVKETISIQDCFVAGQHYRHLSEGTIPLSELIRYPIMVLEKGTSTREYIDNYAKEHGFEISPEIELGSIDLLIQFAKIGLGISCVVRNFVDEEIKDGNLYEVKLSEPIPERKVGIAILKDFPLSAVARKFVEILQKKHSKAEPSIH
jgi:LysR family cyn operon transcriptional activator